MEYPHKISKHDLAKLLGCTDSQIPATCMERFDKHNFAYAPLSGPEREAHILRVLKRLNEVGIKRDSTANIEAFEKGWQENFELCQSQGLTRANLRPKYVRPYECVRYQNDYICPADSYISDHLLWIALHYSFIKYFGTCDAIVEFGCGTGQYVYDLAQLYPNKQLTGTDWTKTSGKILGLMANQGLKVSGRQFDMLRPDLSFELATNTGILTVGAMEQIGSDFRPFLDYMLSQNPCIVIHHEPIEDFYSNETLAGCLGRLWHRSRNYLQGYLTALKELEASGKIEILDSWHLDVGDPFHDSGSRVVWRPK